MFIPTDKCYSQTYSEKLLLAMNSRECRDSGRVKVLGIRVCWVLSPKQDIYTMHSRAQGTWQKSTRKECKSQDRGEGLSSGHDRTIAILISWEPRLPHWLCIRLLILILIRGCGGAQRAQLFPTELWDPGEFWGSHCLQLCAYQWANQALLASSSLWSHRHPS